RLHDAVLRRVRCATNLRCAPLGALGDRIHAAVLARLGHRDRAARSLVSRPARAGRRVPVHQRVVLAIGGVLLRQCDEASNGWTGRLGNRNTRLNSSARDDRPNPSSAVGDDGSKHRGRDVVASAPVASSVSFLRPESPPRALGGTVTVAPPPRTLPHAHPRLRRPRRRHPPRPPPPPPP